MQHFEKDRMRYFLQPVLKMVSLFLFVLEIKNPNWDTR